MLERGSIKPVVLEGCHLLEHFVLVDDSSFLIEAREWQGSEFDVLCGKPAFD
jgi:hypothetical protein